MNHRDRCLPATALRWVLAWLLATVLLSVEAVPLLAQDEAASGFPSENAPISISVAPNDGARITVGTINAPGDSGVFTSRDGGVTWVQARGIPSGLSFAAVEHDVLDPAIIYVGDAAQGLLFRSQDGGTSFAELTAFQDWLSVGSGVGVLYSQEADGFAVLHAGTRSDGVLTSYDHGESWIINAIGLPLEPAGAQTARRVRAIKAFGDDLYVGTHDGVYRQRADSDAWERVPFFEPGEVIRTLAVYRERLYAGLVGAGMFRTADGDAWERVPDFPDIATVFGLTASDQLITAATGVGIWTGNGDQWLKSQVDGGNWSELSWSMDAGPNGQDVYIATDTDWIVRSVDLGFSFETWGSYTELSPQPLPPISRPIAVPVEAESAPAQEAEEDSAQETDQAPAETEAEASEAEAPAPAAESETPVDPTPVPEEAEPAAPQPTPQAAAPSGFQPTFLSGLDLPDVELPFLGPVSLLVFAAAVILLLLIIVGIVSVFRSPEDDGE
ncbi:MAG: hypothetical protein F4Y80_17480 [Caldilineaceae bacterium SB0665_bin_21]|nr:hypothetical protein [Caldilineaceae bacterium SB0665_bin_21]